MKKLFLALSIVSSFLLMSFNSSKMNCNLVNNQEKDPCQEIVFATITMLHAFTDKSNQELADIEAEMLLNCYASLD